MSEAVPSASEAPGPEPASAPAAPLAEHPADPSGSPAFIAALIAESTRKSGLVWVTVDGAPPRPVWHVWRDGAAYVLTGPGEQRLPGLENALTVNVTVRSKDTGSRLVTWLATVTRLDPHTPEWSALVPVLLAGRLNLTDAPTAAERWAGGCLVHRLAPTGEVLADPGQTGSTRSPPAPTRGAPVRPRAPGRVTPGRLLRWLARRRPG